MTPSDPSLNDCDSLQVSFLDLTLPQFWLPEYDWVVCLEVAELVPDIYTDTLLDNIARLAKRGVVLSWAQPGQPGFLHINPRPDSFVQSAMLSRGFARDADESGRMRRVAKFWWFKKNAYVYRRRAYT